MSEELRTAVLAAIAGDGATLVEIHERTGEDSRRTLAMLHALAGQKIATCAREEGRGMVWCLTDESEQDAPTVEYVAPAATPPRRIDPVSMIEQRRNQTGISMADRRQHSVRTQVLRHVLALTRMERSGAISDALQLPVKQVNNALWMLVDSGRIERIGDRGSAVYGPKGIQQRALDKVAEAPQPKAAPSPRAGEIVLQVSVPFNKATAVLRAIEQALA